MRILRMESVKSSIGHKSHASVYNDIREGLFTRSVSIGSRAVGWPDYEVYAICQARIAGWSDAQIRELVTQLHEKRLTACSSI